MANVASSNALRKVGHLGPVTAVAFFPSAESAEPQDCLIAGSGSTLLIYQVRHGKLLEKHAALPGATVHGIRFCTSWCARTRRHTEGRRSGSGQQVVVFGQKRCAIFERSRTASSEGPVLVQSEVVFSEFTDLILDCKIIGQEDGKKELAVGFSHNFVEIWSLDGAAGGGPTCTSRVKCQDHSILYSLTFFGSSRSTLVLAAGTVFNQILLWDPTSSSSDAGTVRQRLVGHNGVIFHIDWDQDGTSIASVSDDRTIRLWQIKHELITKADNTSAEALKQAILHPSSFQEAWASFGHGARVWQCQFFKCVNPQLAPLQGKGIITSAEDASCMIWDRSGKSRTKLNGHALKNVWCSTISNDGLLAATGGSDGSIKLWDVARHVRATDVGSMGTSAAQVSQTEKEHNSLARNGGNVLLLQSEVMFGPSAPEVRSLVMSRSGTVYVSSSEGHLNSVRTSLCPCPDADLSSKEFKTTSHNLFCSKDEGRKAVWCTLALSEDEEYLVAGDMRGMCRVVSAHGQWDVDGAHGTPRSRAGSGTDTSFLEWRAHRTTCWRVVWGNGRKRGESIFTPPSVTRERDSASNFIVGHDLVPIPVSECVVTTSATGDLCVWHVRVAGAVRLGNGAPTPTCVKKYRVHGSKNCFSTTWFGQGYMFCGDNRGHVYIAHLHPRLNEPSPLSSDEFSSWACIVRNSHGTQPVRWTGYLLNSLFSTGHDGNIVEYVLNEGHSKKALLSIAVIHKAAPIAAVEALWETTQMSLVAMGTHTSDLIVYDYTRGYTLFSISMGGWRRPFDIVFFKNLVDEKEFQECSFFMAFTPPPKASRDPSGYPSKKKKKERTANNMLSICQFGRPDKMSKYALQSSFHGRVTTGVKWISKPGEDCAGLIATCSEDGKVKFVRCKTDGSTKSFSHGQQDTWFAEGYGTSGVVSSLQRSCQNTAMESVRTVEMHHSGIRALAIAQSTEATDAFKLVLSAGGHNTICCWRVSTSPADSYAPVVALLSRKCFAKTDGEHRFLSIVTVPSVNGRLPVVFAGNSQGEIYCFHLHVEKAWDLVPPSPGNKLENARQVVFGGEQALDSAVLALKATIQHEDPRKNSPILSLGFVGGFAGTTGILLLTGGSNGMITIWEINDDLVGHNVFCERMHQCGLNCLDQSPQVQEDNTFIVVSGGDDNAFCISLFRWEQGLGPQKSFVSKLQSIRTDNFCGSALQGIRLVGKYVFCAGWNQRLHILRVGLDGNVTRVASCFLDVPDIGDLDVTVSKAPTRTESRFLIAVVGQGIQLLEFDARFE